MKAIKGINWIGIYTFVRKEFERILRIAIQTIAAPLISATLFIFIFGFVLGQRIDLIVGVSYMQFVFPGILTMTIITAAFEHTSSSVYFGRWIKSIHEILVAPFAYIEMVIGFVGSAVLRALFIGSLVLVIGLLFGAVSIAHPLLFIIIVAGIATIFALVGILVALWASSFEQLGLLNVFLISPLTMLGGMFYSIEFLPAHLKLVTTLNPFFYLIDSMRFATIGVHEGNLLIASFLIVGLGLVLGALVLYLFRIGWRIRD